MNSSSFDHVQDKISICVRLAMYFIVLLLFMTGLFIILVAIMRICCILMIGEHAQHACSTPTPLHTITDYTKVLYCRPLHSLPTIHCTCACENRVIRHKLFNSIPGHIQKHGTVNVYFQGFFVLHVHVNVYPKAGINEDYYNI